MVEMTVAPPKPQAPPETPKAEPAVRKLALARPAHVKAAAPPPSAAPPPAAESPADFTGQTLTNEGPGEGWASATGNGEKMNGPVGRPGAHVTRRIVDGDAGGDGPRAARRGARAICRARRRRPTSRTRWRTRTRPRRAPRA